MIRKMKVSYIHHTHTLSRSLSPSVSKLSEIENITIANWLITFVNTPLPTLQTYSSLPQINNAIWIMKILTQGMQLQTFTILLFRVQNTFSLLNHNTLTSFEKDYNFTFNPSNKFMMSFVSSLLLDRLTFTLPALRSDSENLLH